MLDPTGSTSGAPSSPQVKSPIVLKSVAQRFSFIEWLAMAAITILVSIAMLFLQRPWSHPNPFATGARSWWLESIEWNSMRGLPDVIGNLNAVAMQPDGSRVWIAGDRGLLAYSDNFGGCWTKLAYQDATGSFNVADPRCDNGKETRLSLLRVSLRVEAAAAPRQSKESQQTNSTVQQTAPPPASKPTAASPSQTKMVDVPFVQGQPVDLAEKKLVSAGLRLGEIKDGFSVSEIGIVIAQSPNPGEQVPLGTPVNLTVGAKTYSPQTAQVTDNATNKNGTSTKKRVQTPPILSPEVSNWPAPNLLAIGIAKDSATIHASDGRVFTSSDGGEHWKGTVLTAALYSPPLTGAKFRAFSYEYTAGTNGSPPRVTRGGPITAYSAPSVIRSAWDSSPDASCIAGYDKDGGTVQCGKNRESNFPWLQRTGKDHLEDVTFAQDGKVGYAVGANGVVLWTGDGGAHWQPKTQSAAMDMGAPSSGRDWWRWLPPWFYAAWLFGICCAAIAPFSITAPPQVPFIQDYAASDRPLERGDDDALDFMPLAKSLSAFVRNSATKPPLTISINGRWGSGKSSLMNLMCSDLREFGFRAVWFNAWHQQKEEHLLAALLQTVRLEAVPQLWDPRGIGFRFSLILNRLKRYWFPMLLVTGLAVFVFAVDHFHFARTHHSLLADVPRLLPNWIGGTGQDSGKLFAAFDTWPWLGTILGLAALWPVADKLLRAFGTNPAALLATVSRGNRIADLDAQTSFRDKFAKEFRDVTRALGENHQLVIFIDDLDRCRPENVRDVLEAINFLVSSGECFVVMGLERKSVEAAVGLSLKEIAEATSNGKNGVEAWKDYARHFLDKLINLDVPIPELDAEKARRLFYANAAAATDTDAMLADRVRRRRRVKTAVRWAHGLDFAARLVTALSITAALLLAAYQGGMQLELAAKNAVHATPPGAPVEQSQTASGQQNQNGAAPPGEPSTQPLGPLPEVQPGSNPRPSLLGLSVPELAGFALLATFAYYAFAGAKKGAAHDSPNFVKALDIWYPLVIARQSTPRAVKRWMNRVRYLATREMPTSELRNPVERIADWYAALGSAESIPARVTTTEPLQPPGPVRIPEEIVVALAAIFELNPEILSQPSALADLQQSGYVHASGELIETPSFTDFSQLVIKKRAQHAEQFGKEDWGKIKQHLPRFLAMWPSIDIQ